MLWSHSLETRKCLEVLYIIRSCCAPFLDYETILHLLFTRSKGHGSGCTMKPFCMKVNVIHEIHALHRNSNYIGCGDI